MSAFPDTFFEDLLANESRYAAMRRSLREAPAFESGLEQEEPIPRAQPFFGEGEWELSMTLAPLNLVKSDDACFGLISTLSTPRNTVYTRFCGKANRRDKCGVRSHHLSKLRVDLQTPG